MRLTPLVCIWIGFLRSSHANWNGISVQEERSSQLRGSGDWETELGEASPLRFKGVNEDVEEMRRLADTQSKRKEHSDDIPKLAREVTHQKQSKSNNLEKKESNKLSQSYIRGGGDSIQRIAITSLGPEVDLKPRHLSEKLEKRRNSESPKAKLAKNTKSKKKEEKLYSGPKETGKLAKTAKETKKHTKKKDTKTKTDETKLTKTRASKKRSKKGDYDRPKLSKRSKKETTLESEATPAPSQRVSEGPTPITTSPTSTAPTTTLLPSVMPSDISSLKTSFPSFMPSFSLTVSENNVTFEVDATNETTAQDVVDELSDIATTIADGIASEEIPSGRLLQEKKDKGDKASAIVPLEELGPNVSVLLTVEEDLDADCPEKCFIVVYTVLGSDMGVNETDVRQILAERLGDVCVVEAAHAEANPDTTIAFRDIEECGESGSRSICPGIGCPDEEDENEPEDSASFCPGSGCSAIIALATIFAVIGILLLLAMLLMPITGAGIAVLFDDEEKLQENEEWEQYVLRMEMRVKERTEGMLKQQYDLKDKSTEVKVARMIQGDNERVVLKLFCDFSSKKEMIATAKECIAQLSNGYDLTDEDVKLIWDGSVLFLLSLPRSTIKYLYERLQKNSSMQVDGSEVKVAISPAVRIDSKGLRKGVSFPDVEFSSEMQTVLRECIDDEVMDVCISDSLETSRNLLGTSYYRSRRTDISPIVRFLCKCFADEEPYESTRTGVEIILPPGDPKVLMIEKSNMEDIQKYEDKGYRRIDYSGKPDANRYAFMQFQGIQIKLKDSEGNEETLPRTVTVEDAKRFVYDRRLFKAYGVPVSRQKLSRSDIHETGLDDRNSLWSYGLRDGDTLFWNEETQLVSSAPKQSNGAVEKANGALKETNPGKSLSVWRCDEWQDEKRSRKLSLHCRPVIDLSIVPKISTEGDLLQLKCLLEIDVADMTNESESRGFFVETIDFTVKPDVALFEYVGNKTQGSAVNENTNETGFEEHSIPVPTASSYLPDGQVQKWHIDDSLPQAQWRFNRGTWGSPNNEPYDLRSKDALTAIWGEEGRIPSVSNSMAEIELTADWKKKGTDEVLGEVKAQVAIVITMRAIERRSIDEKVLPILAHREEMIFEGNAILARITQTS